MQYGLCAARALLPQPVAAFLRYHHGSSALAFLRVSAMNIVPEIAALIPEMNEWRHHIHAHPETAFEETATAAFVADKLAAFGLEVHTGLAKTRVVGVLRRGDGAATASNGNGR